MYKIIGADGKEYGPVEAEVLKQWIAENRLSAQMQVLPAGARAWMQLGELPEFAGTFPVGRGATPVAPPSTRSMGRVSVHQLVRGPGTALMVVGGLNIALALFSLILSLSGLGERWFGGARASHNEIVRTLGATAGSGYFVKDSIGLIGGVVGLLGGFKLRKLQNFGLCVAASVLTMFPCTSPFCMFGLPAGIWALVIICRPEVKAQFR